MRSIRIVAVPLVLLAVVMGCHPKGSKAPAWAVNAPEGTSLALSVQAGWVLDHQNVQSLVARFPLADQMLDLFLKKARINPHDDPGRVTFYVLDLPQQDLRSPHGDPGNFLMLLDGFKNPVALQGTVVESFPQEGSLTLAGKELPLHVILDINAFHLRAALEPSGKIWLGDLRALTRRAQRGQAEAKATLHAAEWIDPKGIFQGYIKVEALLTALQGQLPKDLGLDLPEGIDTIAWSVSPAPSPAAPHRLDLALTGTETGIQKVTPWLQRIGAVATTTGPNSAPPPDLVIERTRAGFRAAMTEAQLNALLSKLGSTPLRLTQPGSPKA